MARRVFFSFHYQNDIWRANQIRNSWVTQDRQSAGFWDAASWEKVKRGGDEAIKQWVENQLDGTSVTVVLIGNETSQRRYVKHEIKRSYALDKGILGIWIHRIKDESGYASSKGANPFDQLYVEENGRKTYLSELYPTYEWIADDGYENFADWVEDAARSAGR